jgi:hypothetical protein
VYSDAAVTEKTESTLRYEDETIEVIIRDLMKKVEKFRVRRNEKLSRLIAQYAQWTQSEQESLLFRLPDGNTFTKSVCEYFTIGEVRSSLVRCKALLMADLFVSSGLKTAALSSPRRWRLTPSFYMA